MFRPHPSERATVSELYPELSKADRVEFDPILDVYQSLREVRAVFGHASTVLFEAVSFSCTTYVFDSSLADHMASHPAFGERITDDSSLARAVTKTVTENLATSQDSTSAATTHRAQMEALSKPNAIENFREFIDNALGER
jgi:hypothetical protein